MEIIIPTKFFSCPVIFCKEDESPFQYNQNEFIINTYRSKITEPNDKYMINGRFWTVHRKDDSIETNLAFKEIEQGAKIIIPVSETELRKIGYLRYGKYRDAWLQKKNWKRFEDKAREEIEYSKALNLLEEAKKIDLNQ